MSYVTCLRGIGSGACYPADRLMNLCPVDGRPLEMQLDLERLARERPHASWYRAHRADMWRFGALLALDHDDPLDRTHIVTMGEGATPIVDYSDHPLARRARFMLEVKDEGSTNPTGSF